MTEGHEYAQELADILVSKGIKAKAWSKAGVGARVYVGDQFISISQGGDPSLKHRGQASLVIEHLPKSWRTKVKEALEEYRSNIAIKGPMQESLRQIANELRENTELSPEDAKERQAVAKRGSKNPFVYKSKMAPHTYSIGLWVPNKAEPLWWTDGGFADLSRVRAREEEFETEAEATTKLKNEAINVVIKWRHQGHLIIGW